MLGFILGFATASTLTVVTVLSRESRADVTCKELERVGKVLARNTEATDEQLASIEYSKQVIKSLGDFY